MTKLLEDHFKMHEVLQDLWQDVGLPAQMLSIETEISVDRVSDLLVGAFPTVVELVALCNAISVAIPDLGKVSVDRSGHSHEDLWHERRLRDYQWLRRQVGPVHYGEAIELAFDLGIITEQRRDEFLEGPKG